MVQCKAKSKRSRIHGALAGPKTKEGINRIKQANTKHGNYTKEAFTERKAFRNLLKECKEHLNEMDI